MTKWEQAARFTGVGFFIGGSIVLGVFLGLWADSKLGTSFLWLIGLILGLVVAFYGMFRMLLPLINNRRNGDNS